MQRKLKKVSLVLCIIFLFTGSVFAAEKFTLKNLSAEYNSETDMTAVQGELTNNSGRAYKAAGFKISFYKDTKLLGTVDLVIQNLEKDETVTFDDFGRKNLTGWSSYKIRLDSSF